MTRRSIILFSLLALVGCKQQFIEPATAPSSVHAPSAQAATGVQRPAAPVGHDTILRPAADQQRRELRRLVYELRYVIDNLVPQAQYYSDPDARVRFDWHQLTIDLNRVVAGIESHLNEGVTAPRFIAPIQGNYGR